MNKVLVSKPMFKFKKEYEVWKEGELETWAGSD